MSPVVDDVRGRVISELREELIDREIEFHGENIFGLFKLLEDCDDYEPGIETLQFMYSISITVNDEDTVRYLILNSVIPLYAFSFAYSIGRYNMIHTLMEGVLLESNLIDALKREGEYDVVDWMYSAGYGL